MKSILSIFEIGQRGVGRLTFFKRIQPLLLKFKGIIPDFAIKRFINKEMIYIIKCYDIFYNNDRFLPILSDYKIAKGILYMFDLTDESSITYIKNEFLLIVNTAKEISLTEVRAKKDAIVLYCNQKNIPQLPIYIIEIEDDSEKRVISKQEVKNFCEENGLKYFECDENIIAC